MANTIEKWLNHEFSSGTVAGDDYKKFQRAAKADLKKKAESVGYTLHSFRPGHYEFSAVLCDTETEKFIYVAIRDVRYYGNKWYNEVLYRTMENDKDNRTIIIYPYRFQEREKKFRQKLLSWRKEPFKGKITIKPQGDYYSVNQKTAISTALVHSSGPNDFENDLEYLRADEQTLEKSNEKS